MFYFPTGLSEEWSDEPAGVLLLHCATHASTGGASLEAAASPPAHSRRSNQEIVQMKWCVGGKWSLSPCWPLKRAVFSGSVGPGHLFSMQVCRKWAFLPSALAYQSPFFISIKALNGNFPAKLKFNIFVAFWKCICCPSAFLSKDAG